MDCRNKVYLIIATLSIMATPALAFGFIGEVGRWVGDRTGLRRPVEEVTGIAEMRRTQEARDEARRAEDEVNGLNQQVAARQAELTEAERELARETGAFLAFKGRVRQAMSPVTSQIVNLVALSTHMQNENQKLIESSGRITAELAAFRQSLASFSSQNLSTQSLVDGEAQVALRLWNEVIALSGGPQSLPRSLVDSYTTFARLVGHLGRSNLDMLLTTQQLATVTLSSYIESSIPNLARTVGEGFLRLREKIAQVKSGLEAVNGAANEIERSTRQ